MPQTLKGKRVAAKTGEEIYNELKEPGDYCGPIKGFTGDKEAVFFLLPIARDDGVPSEARSLHHVESPPHRFIENSDGTLSIYESIGAGPSKAYYWHGFLWHGEWILDRRDP